MYWQFVSKFAVWFDGQVIAGAILSVMVTSKVQSVVFPFPSSAVKVIVVSAVTIVPAIGLCVTVTTAVQLSVAVANAV